MTNESNVPTELVRGNVKAAMKTAGAGSADLWNVKPQDIKFIDGFNLRSHNAEYEAHIEYLTQSIMQNGYYQDKPIAGYVVVNPDGTQTIVATDGHSRVTATLRAIKAGSPIETLPMVIKPKGTTMEDLTIAMINSNEGRPFTPYEKGLAIKRLVSMGLTEKDIAKRLAMTVPYVGDLLNLVGAPKAVREMVASGQVSATAAVTTLKKHGAKASEKLAKGLERATAAGKTKVTAKSLTSLTKLRLTGVIKTTTAAGKSSITITLDAPLDVELISGDTVKLIITQGDEEL